LGTKRYGWKNRNNFERARKKKSFNQLVEEGKAMTAEELRAFHASVYRKMEEIIGNWNSIENDVKQKREKFMDFQACLLILCHFKIAAQRQGAIALFTTENIQCCSENNRYCVEFDFKEKKVREGPQKLYFPEDKNPFWKLQDLGIWFHSTKALRYHSSLSKIV
jgi:hypothetical protein